MAPTRASTCSRWPARDWPAIRMVPADGWVRLTSIRMTVVLPAPLWPRNPNAQPAGTVRLKSETAVRKPKRLVSPRVSMMGGAVVMGQASGAVGLAGIGRKDGSSLVGTVLSSGSDRKSGVEGKKVELG